MAHWTEYRESGSRFWLVLIRWVILRLGRPFALIWMFPTTAYFYLRLGRERRASREWLRRAGVGRGSAWQVMCHLFTFAVTLVDRVLLLSGRERSLAVRLEGQEELAALLSSGQGCILLGSHLGSFDAARVVARDAPGSGLRVVMDRQHNPLTTQILESLAPDVAATVIDPRDLGPAIVLEIRETIARGGMVALLADRAAPQEALVRVPFLGRPAPFPLAPLRIAAALRAPVFLVFGLYEGRGRYHVVFERLAEMIELGDPRDPEAIRPWVEGYAGRLECYARRYPYNWFNFYDFWDESVVAGSAGTARRRGSGTPQRAGRVAGGG